MLVLVDESGDVGFKFAKGSSRLFAVTVILFEDHEEAKRCDLRLDLLRHELRLPKGFEFHFHKNSPEIRKAFLQAIASFNFFCFTVVIDKEKLNLKALPTVESFYQYACSLVFENAKPYLNEADVIIDGRGSRDFKRRLQQHLKKKTNDPSARFRYIKKVRIEDSARSNLLQLADMVCGAIYRSFLGKHDARAYRDFIAHREVSVEMLPK
jgi:hypothetical protein